MISLILWTLLRANPPRTPWLPGFHGNLDGMAAPTLLLRTDLENKPLLECIPDKNASALLTPHRVGLFRLQVQAVYERRPGKLAFVGVYVMYNKFCAEVVIILCGQAQFRSKQSSQVAGLSCITFVFVCVRLKRIIVCASGYHYYFIVCAGRVFLKLKVEVATTVNLWGAW